MNPFAGSKYLVNATQLREFPTHDHLTAPSVVIAPYVVPQIGGPAPFVPPAMQIWILPLESFTTVKLV